MHNFVVPNYKFFILLYFMFGTKYVKDSERLFQKKHGKASPSVPATLFFHSTALLTFEFAKTCIDLIDRY